VIDRLERRGFAHRELIRATAGGPGGSRRGGPRDSTTPISRSAKHSRKLYETYSNAELEFLAPDSEAASR